MYFLILYINRNILIFIVQPTHIKLACQIYIVVVRVVFVEASSDSSYTHTFQSCWRYDIFLLLCSTIYIFQCLSCNLPSLTRIEILSAKTTKSHHLRSDQLGHQSKWSDSFPTWWHCKNCVDLYFILPFDHIDWWLLKLWFLILSNQEYNFYKKVNIPVRYNTHLWLASKILLKAVASIFLAIASVLAMFIAPQYL